MTVEIASLVSDNLDIWTTAVERKSGAGRGGAKRINLYGIDRLRPLIVDLAVRGKLTPQRPDEEPASVAVAKLAKARRFSIESGKARKLKAFRSLPADLPALPDGWVWTQLGTIAEISPSNRADDGVDASFIPMSLISTRIDGAHEAEIRKWGDIKKGFTHFANGDVGVAKITPCFENGKAAVFENLANSIGAGTTELHIARPWSDDVNRRFLLLTMKTASYLQAGEAGMTGTAGQKRVTRAFFEASPLALPPIAEQQRIVAKVDELMALCDALEAESAAAMAAHQALVEALLATLTASTDAAVLATNWARLEAHFDTLFTTEASVDALKQTVLDLAVRGKLAAQDGGDEPANEIIKRIGKEYEEKSEGGHRGRQSKNEPKSEILGFDLPAGWAEPHLGAIGETFIGLTYSPKDVGETGTPVLRSSNVQNGEIDLADLVRVRSQVRQKLFVESGDLLICVRNGSKALVGKCALIANLSEPMTFGAFMAIYKSPLNSYVKLYIESPTFRRRLLGVETTTINQITQANLKTTPIPLPPLAEQSRIVAKVDELMALCDALKTRITDAATTQKHLADAITERAAA